MTQSVRLGGFVLITLGILGLFVFLVGNTQSKFQSNFRIQAQFRNVSGLEDGADVRIGGLHKGTVRKIALPAQPEGQMTVVMDLSKETRNLIKQDSQASIKSEGLVGNKYVEISFGSKDGQPVQEGGTIQSEPPLDIADLVAKANGILDSTKSTVDNLNVATGNVGSITGKINEGKGTVGALVNDKTMYREATAGATALREDADALKHNFLLRGFFNKRGFADQSEIKQHLIGELPKESPQKTFTFEAKQIFDKADSAKLKNQKSLNEAGEFLQTQPGAGLVVIEASAGPKGDSAKEKDLSEARAFAARAYLVDHFKLDDSRLRIRGIGKSDNEAELQIMVYPR
jgi:phospholipid/cholesterol/gamma-HCH transport system substrate-binding protein